MLWWMSGRGEGVWTPLSALNAEFGGSGRGIGGNPLVLQFIIEVKLRGKSYRPPTKPCLA
jgi:hypothetical protein